MSGWGVETMDGGVLRRAGARGGPALWFYYWSPANTPAATQEYLRRHALRSRSFRGGHWPMVDDPDGTAHDIASFFEPLTAAHLPA